jgi:hypothetical protein
MGVPQCQNRDIKYPCSYAPIAQCQIYKTRDSYPHPKTDFNPTPSIYKGLHDLLSLSRKKFPEKIFELERLHIMEWFGFWLFLSVLLVCDTWLFSKGYKAFFWSAKTEDEKAIHKKASEK